jgi:hypothetical protein
MNREIRGTHCLGYDPAIAYIGPELRNEVKTTADINTHRAGFNLLSQYAEPIFTVILMY